MWTNVKNEKEKQYKAISLIFNRSVRNLFCQWWSAQSVVDLHENNNYYTIKSYDSNGQTWQSPTKRNKRQQMEVNSAAAVKVINNTSTTICDTDEWHWSFNCCHPASDLAVTYKPPATHETIAHTHAHNTIHNHTVCVTQSVYGIIFLLSYHDRYRLQ